MARLATVMVLVALVAVWAPMADAKNECYYIKKALKCPKLKTVNKCIKKLERESDGKGGYAVNIAKCFSSLGDGHIGAIHVQRAGGSCKPATKVDCKTTKVLAPATCGSTVSVYVEDARLKPSSLLTKSVCSIDSTCNVCAYPDLKITPSAGCETADEGKPCTKCAYTCARDSECDDKNPCTVNTCSGGKCYVAFNRPAGTDCATDTNLCTTETCDGYGKCVSKPTVCYDDGYACTNTTCDPLTGCGQKPSDAACQQAAVDSGMDQCITSSVCNPKAADGCAPLTGCTYTYKKCDDTYSCTVDTCEKGKCSFKPEDSLCPDLDPSKFVANEYAKACYCTKISPGKCDTEYSGAKTSIRVSKSTNKDDKGSYYQVGPYVKDSKLFDSDTGCSYTCAK